MQTNEKINCSFALSQPIYMKIKLSILIFLASIIQLNAQDSTYRFSLQQAIEFAYQNQTNVKNALLDEQIAKQRVNEIKGMGTPQINGDVDLNKFIDIPTSFVPAEFFGGEPGSFAAVQFGLPYTSTANITATQLLFDGSYLVGLKASKTFQELSTKQTLQTKIETSVAVSKAYYLVLVSSASLELVKANEIRVKKYRDDLKLMFENGLVEKLDLDRAELNYNNILVQKQNIERISAIAYSTLKFQMGMAQTANLLLTDQLDESKWGAMSIPTQADYNNRNEYSLMQTQERFKELDLKNNRSKYYPSLVAFGSAGTTAARSEFNILNSDYRWYPTTIVGLKLTVPIWNGLQTNSRVKQSKLELNKIQNSMETFKQSVTFEFENAKSNLQNNLSELETSKKNRELATEIVRVTKIKFDNGVGSSLEMANAEADLKEAENNYFRAMYNTIISKIDVDKALGNIK